MSAEVFSVNAIGLGAGFSVASERKPCVRCGHERQVKVSRKVMPDGRVLVHYTELCAACQADADADSHERKAAALRKKAAEIRARIARNGC